MQHGFEREQMKNISLLFLILLSIPLLFLNLGERTLWNDEAEQARVSLNVVRYGYPTAYDGKQYIRDYTESDIYNYRGEKAVWIWSPWLPFYPIAASYLVFGVSTWSARFPMALVALLLIPLFYFTTKRWFNDKIAFWSTFLLIINVPFLLYARQARYYSVAMFMAVAMLWAYHRLIKKEPYAWTTFVICSILTFHTFYITFFGMLSGITIHLLFFYRRRLFSANALLSYIAIALGTLPFFLYAQLGTKSGILSILSVLFKMIHGASYFFIYVIPIILIISIPFLLIFTRQKKEHYVFSLFALIFVASLFFNSLTIWELAQFRYIIFLIPICMMLLGYIIVSIAKNHAAIAGIVVLLLIFTTYLHVLPLYPLRLVDNVLSVSPATQDFINDTIRPRFLLPAFLYEITHTYESAQDQMIKALRTYGTPQDIIFPADHVITFYTDMVDCRGLTTCEEADIPWLIPRTFNKDDGGKGEEHYAFSLQRSQKGYTPLFISDYDYSGMEDDPQPRNHRFIQTKKGVPLTIYHLGQPEKSTDYTDENRPWYIPKE